jgi:hypothetical protein
MSDFFSSIMVPRVFSVAPLGLLGGLRVVNVPRGDAPGYRSSPLCGWECDRLNFATFWL